MVNKFHLTNKYSVWESQSLPYSNDISRVPLSDKVVYKRFQNWFQHLCTESKQCVPCEIIFV